MKRRIIEIDEEKCNGCGACASACHEGAIGMVDGKARLLRDDYCDGLGDCLPSCPTGAISFVEREAAEYDEAAVAEHMARRAIKDHKNPLDGAHSAPGLGFAGLAHGGGCPGHRLRTFDRTDDETAAPTERSAVSQLRQWPCQIRLVPVTAPYFDGAKLLIAADCTAYAYARMHEEFMRGRITLIGCPKLDDTDYSEKLGAIISENDIKEVTVIRMEVPCCGGLEAAAKAALKASGKFIPWQVVTVSVDGKLLD